MPEVVFRTATPAKSTGATIANVAQMDLPQRLPCEVVLTSVVYAPMQLFPTLIGKMLTVRFPKMS